MLPPRRSPAKLGAFLSTAISGNNIMSSVLYVSGIVALFAGVYAPLVLLAVAGVLYLYRGVYREVVEALPVNGGTYNALLNSASKPAAAIAGVMTILSYMATAVISAKIAVEYLFLLIRYLAADAGWAALASRLEAFVLPAAALLLLVFALLVIAGIKDSAYVAAGIFVLHLITLAVFIVIGWFATPTGVNAAVNLAATKEIIAQSGGLAAMLFFAFSAALLSVSGFESSANFVEEQRPGVFKKTLANMTIGFLIFSPLTALVVLRTLPLAEIAAAKDSVVAAAAFKIGGPFFLGAVSIDAFLVLSGAVLASFIGVSGLIRRMALDDCLPSFLVRENKNGSSRAPIALAFFALCASILAVTRGELLSLAGVYTISFLGVMSLFAIGNLVLRKTRQELKRPYAAPFPLVILALFATITGLIGNIALDQKNALFFLMYFIPAVTLTLSIVYKKDFFLSLKTTFAGLPALRTFFTKRFSRAIRNRVYVFLHNVSSLYPILSYINKNESTHFITVIHCRDGNDRETVEEMKRLLPELRRAGVFPHLRIDFKYLDRDFGPETINSFAENHEIPKNRIFIGSVRKTHPFEYSDFGGVRIIL